MIKAITILFSLFLGALLGCAVFLWLASGEIYDYEDTFVFERDGPQIDVVLCLAGGKGRIPAAVEWWQKLKNHQKRKYPPILFFSGVGPHADQETLIEQGVPKEQILQMGKDEVVFENVSTNTFENAQIFSSFVHQKKWKHVLLITSGYHMRRATDILKKAVGSEVQIFTHTVEAEHFGRKEWHQDEYAIRVTLMEYIKWIFYRYSY